jgi:hypothetical protein
MIWKVACANGKGIKKTLKVRPTSIPKSMKKRYNNYARKSDASNIEKHQKWSSKEDQQQSKPYQKSIRKKDWKNEHFGAGGGWVIKPPGKPPGTPGTPLPPQ